MVRNKYLILERFTYNEDATFGRLYFPDREDTYFTVELPWLDNRRNVSCIPEGIYSLKKRWSNVVMRSTGGEFQEGWEVQNVEGRSWIMLHPGNWPSDLEGCIAPGKGFAAMQDPKGTSPHGVTNSRQAFSEVMHWLDESVGPWHLIVTKVSNMDS